ncbi:MAG: small, acid-soluble spore protein, alpha/beta type [Limnochordia bacterium]|jgi:small acid-soluble spore protein F (minor alpha/beta-type SASP)|nr:small, acid-soluble spore protein, alpha/beta type [Bacillota bacterium]HOB08610.1 small, acid-soluble spore protein, alpha/beta type [Limnochordia bacterium]NLH30737.1 small, acid-soluble spore protein, alpha/beta type [Bacillota bacterium]HPT92758.1 small, acid-soluble spore protein, alpha/beta type [Limnochordia bacterium]HPZ30751.1 small, acid-soluble spore protein, alpha/beta type [Limnochordia bacterium]
MPRRGRIMSDRLKYELAQDLGFYDKVKDGDWGNITTRDAGNLVKAAIMRAEKMMAEADRLPQQQ